MLGALATCLLAAVPGIAWADDPADGAPGPVQILGRAESLMQAAEEDMRAGIIERAGQSLGQAERLLETLHSEHPKWNSADVERLLDACRARIAFVIQQLLRKDPAPPVRPSPPDEQQPPPSPAAAPGSPASQADMQSYEKKMEQLAAHEIIAHEFTMAEEDLRSSPQKIADAAVEEHNDKPTRRGRGIFNLIRKIFSRGGDDPEAPFEAADDKPSTDDAIRLAAVDAGPPSLTPSAAAPASVAPREQIDILLRANESGTAIALLLDHIAQAPRSREWRLLLAIAYCQSQAYDRPREVTRQLLREDTTDAKAHIVLGTAFLGLGNIQIAKDQMQIALDLNPSLGEAHYNLARIWASIEPPDIAGARMHYEKALKRGEPKDKSLERGLQ